MKNSWAIFDKVISVIIIMLCDIENVENVENVPKNPYQVKCTHITVHSARSKKIWLKKKWNERNESTRSDTSKFCTKLRRWCVSTVGVGVARDQKFGERSRNYLGNRRQWRQMKYYIMARNVWRAASHSTHILYISANLRIFGRPKYENSAKSFQFRCRSAVACRWQKKWIKMEKGIDGNKIAEPKNRIPASRATKWQRQTRISSRGGHNKRNGTNCQTHSLATMKIFIFS